MKSKKKKDKRGEWWKDPEKREKAIENFRKAALKRKYSKKGFASLQKHMREKVNTPEHYETRDQSYTQTPEFRELHSKKMKNLHKMWKKEKNVKVLPRINTHSGVLTEQEMASL